MMVPVHMIPNSNTSKELNVASTKILRTEIQKRTIRKDVIYVLVRTISIILLLNFCNDIEMSFIFIHVMFSI